ncbi:MULTISPECIES: nuclear transport factor 2 family protein [Rhodococcus]|uniref:nuclear transport factor 2 family protein n=1 Tax=Rhodococcus TaxID=1827 RepID=UPI00120FB133|nr:MULTISPECIES: nuclear transport factor 2 family protein [Rhodococcus]QXW00004.1 nuclear transport factor 2 family protein [Rhodococcus globerulus]RZL22132.1 MAG: nuclear transport factor 2 family protein [Rhodococcus sp. (in: high G+C Gram-positive bacteria)]
MSNQTIDLTAVAEKFIDAYNSGDLGRLEAVFGEDAELTHHNRGGTLAGRPAIMAMFEASGQMMPGKTFVDRQSLDVLGPDRVVVRHTWTVTPTVDVPGMAAAGEKISLDLATFLTFRDGVVVDYHDFG